MEAVGANLLTRTFFFVAVPAHDDAVVSAIDVAASEIGAVVQTDFASRAEPEFVLVPPVFFFFFFFLNGGLVGFGFNPPVFFFVEPAADFGASAFCPEGVTNALRVSTACAPRFTFVAEGFVFRIDAAFYTADVEHVFMFHCRRLLCSCGPVVA